MSWKAALKPYHLKLYFSNKYSYAQIIRQGDGHIVAAASTIEKALREQLPKTATKEVLSVLNGLKSVHTRMCWLVAPWLCKSMRKVCRVWVEGLQLIDLT